MPDQTPRPRRSAKDVFGEALPRIAPGERDDPSPEDEAERDRWLRENRPPHHF
jgi:hypothetical protein